METRRVQREAVQGTTMSTKSFWQKLQALQCHFMWCLEIKDEVIICHVLQTLAQKVEHTAYHNRSVYLAMRAYLQHLEGKYPEALDSLQQAEKALRQDHPTDFAQQVLPIYGNYAWIYYYLSNYEVVELYLGRIREICRSLSSPDLYSVQSPGIHAQKGWSLLAWGFRNGEEATKCFQRALQGDKSNQDFQAGLATSVFASWTHSWSLHLEEEAQSVMEKILCCQPQNYEIKVYLANLLERKDWPRARALAMEVAENSLNPEDLRNTARLLKRHSLPQAIDVLRQAIALAPGYHLLHYDLGICYKKQLEEGAAPGEREETLVAAIKSFKRAVETDSQSIFSRLELAQLYAEKAPLYAEEMYLNLLEQVPKVSKRCQQAIYLHWGDLLLHRKGLRSEALEMYKVGFAVSGGHPKEWHQLKGRLRQLARMFKENSEVNRAEEVLEILRLRPHFQ